MNGDSAQAKLQLHLEGPSVAEGRIALSDLADVAESIQKAVRQIGSIIQTGDSNEQGQLPKALEQATRLELAALKTGSVRLEIDFPPEIDRKMNGNVDLGEAALASFVDGIAALDRSEDDPVHWNDSVFRAVEPLGTVIRRGGVAAIGVTREGQQARFTRATSDRVQARLKAPPKLEFVRVTGRLMMIDFNPTRRLCRLDLLDGRAVDCDFPTALMSDMRQFATGVVEVAGHQARPHAKRPGRLSIEQISPLRSPANATVGDPGKTAVELIADQQVGESQLAALIDPGLWDDGDLDSFLVWVDEHRNADRV